MTISLIVNGNTYFYPENGDIRWGPEATDWAQAVTTGMLQKAGGLFQLLSEVDFGITYGLKANYYKSRTADISSTGVLRLARTDAASWRNNANDADLDLTVNASNELTFAGVPLGRLYTVSDTDSIDLTLTAGDLSADLRLSANTADSGYQLVEFSIESDGLFGQVSQTFSALTLTGASGVIIATAGVLSSESLLSPTRGGTGVNNSGTFTYGSNNLSLTTSGTTSLTLPTSGTVATLAGAETFTNKTMGSTNTLTGVTMANITNSGTVSFPTSTDTLVARNTTDTLTNKTMGSTNTLTGATAASFTNTGTVTLFTATDTVVGKATTDTLTNKTLTAPNIGTDAKFANQAIAKFYEQTGTGTNYIGLSAPNAITADVTLKLPDGDGSNGQFITTDGSGNLSWGNASGLVNPMTTMGDMIYGGVAGAATRLASSTANLVLQTNSTGGAPTWVAIVNANISASAAIAYSKLSLTGSIVNADVNASAAIVYSKLSLTGSIVNADINASAAIAGSKIVSASASVAGVVDTTTQSFAGDKTFGGALSVTGATTVGVTGIVFQVSPTLSANANTMEGYKEVDFIPSISFGGGTTGLTLSSPLGRYTRTGRVVVYTGGFSVSNIGSSTGNLRLNLPFALNLGGSSGNTLVAGTIVGQAYNVTAAAGINCFGNEADSYVTLCYNTAGTGTTLFTNALSANNMFFTFCITFTTASAF